jgi:hypothetical protein
MTIIAKRGKNEDTRKERVYRRSITDMETGFACLCNLNCNLMIV